LQALGALVGPLGWTAPELTGIVTSAAAANSSIVNFSGAALGGGAAANFGRRTIQGHRVGLERGGTTAGGTIHWANLMQFYPTGGGTIEIRRRVLRGIGIVMGLMPLGIVPPP
jgi:hypothetical protein